MARQETVLETWRVDGVRHRLVYYAEINALRVEFYLDRWWWSERNDTPCLKRMP